METSSNYISILSDYGFKVTFADEVDTTFLRRALQAALKWDREIKEVEFIKNENSATTKDSRGGLYDLLCRDEDNNFFIVEMQLSFFEHFIQRSKFYAFQRFNTLVRKGKYLFDDLTPIYCIGFLSKNIYPNSEQYYHKGLLRNQEGETMDDQIVHIIIEISKFDKKEEELDTDLDKLIFFMKNQQHIHAGQNQAILNEAWITDMIEKLDKSNMSQEERALYEHNLAKNASIIYSFEQEKKRAVAAAEKAAAKKAKAAAEKAKAVTEKAKAAAKKAKAVTEKAKAKAVQRDIDIVKGLKSKGMSTTDIAEITGLSIAEIEKV